MGVFVVILCFLWFNLKNKDYRSLLDISGIFDFFIIGLSVTYVVHLLRLVFSPSYRHERAGVKKIGAKMQEIRGKVESIFQSVPPREKGPQFKKAYDLTGKSLAELEQTLAIGCSWRSKKSL